MIYIPLHARVRIGAYAEWKEYLLNKSNIYSFLNKDIPLWIIEGPPGAGKSTLLEYIRELAKQQRK